MFIFSVSFQLKILFCNMFKIFENNTFFVSLYFLYTYPPVVLYKVQSIKRGGRYIWKPRFQMSKYIVLPNIINFSPREIVPDGKGLKYI